MEPSASIRAQWVKRQVSSLSNKFRIEAAKVGVFNALFHRLRHTFVTALALGGVDKRAAMEIVGHASDSVHDTYTHIDAMRFRGELQKLNLKALQGQVVIVPTPEGGSPQPDNVVPLPRAMTS